MEKKIEDEKIEDEKIEDEINENVEYELKPKLDEEGKPEVDAEGAPVLEPEVDDEGNQIVKEKPLFLTTDADDIVEEDDKSEALIDKKMIPLSAHIVERDKLKKQRTELGIENDELKAENEKLKNKAQIPDQTLKRPRRDDFEDDEDYYTARDEYDKDRDARILDSATQKNNQRAESEKQQRDTNQKMQDHYVRADELIKEHNITSEAYINADTKVRNTIEAVLPGQGKDGFNFLFSTLGIGSEKVGFYLGNSEKKLIEFQTLLQADPGGHSAAMFLGGLKKEMEQNTNKRTSQARKPAAQVTHGKMPSTAGKAAKKAYDKAEGQEAYEIKKRATANGIDTKGW